MRKLVVIAMTFICILSYSQSEWELIHGSNSSFNLGNAFSTDTSHTWGTIGGSIYFSPDMGYTWELLYENPDYNFADIFFLDSLTGWCAGWSEVLKTTNGGESWILQYPPNQLGMDLEDVFFINQDTGWIAGSYKMIYGTYDGGDNWISLHDYEFSDHYFLEDIHFSDASHGCAVGGGMQSGQPIIMTTENAGETWIELFPENYGKFIGVHFIDSSNVWACTDNGKLYKSTDGGLSWEVYLYWNILNPQQMYFFDENKAIIASGFRQVITEDGWLTHDTVEFGLYDAISRFTYADPEHGLAVGSNNFLLTYNGGYNWTRLNERFYRIAFFNPLNGWIIQEHMNEKLMHSADGGITWIETETGQNGLLLEMSFPTDQVGYIISSESELLKTIDAGQSWEIIDLPYVPINVTDFQFLDETTGFICHYPDRLFKTVDGGYTWEEFQIDTLISLTACDFINSNEGWVIGWDGICGKTIDGGLTWNFVDLGEDGLREIKFIDEDNGIITSQFRIFRSSDGGRNWQQLDLFLNQPQNIEFADTLNGWITDRANVYRTNDGGWTWLDSTNLDSENQQDIITDLYLLDSTNAWICTMDGRVYSLSIEMGDHENNPAEAIKLFPNPVSTVLSIEFNRKIEDEILIEIYSMEGKLVSSTNLFSSSGNRSEINMSNAPGGIYFVRILNSTIHETYKIVKH
jgi:photosystem II stability/assembly factor-like uncharacterized protein